MLFREIEGIIWLVRMNGRHLPWHFVMLF
jgi:hypothetical protein